MCFDGVVAYSLYTTPPCSPRLAAGSPHAVEAAFAHTTVHANPGEIGNSRGGTLVKALEDGNHTAGSYEAQSLLCALRGLYDMHAALQAGAADAERAYERWDDDAPAAMQRLGRTTCGIPPRRQLGGRRPRQRLAASRRRGAAPPAATVYRQTYVPCCRMYPQGRCMRASPVALPHGDG